MKEYKGRLCLTSVITLLPIVVGILFWNKLPEQMATHFDMHNVPNGWSSKFFAVIGLPLILVVLHLFSVCVTLNDPKKKNIGKWMLNIVFWTIPIVSVIVNGATISYALGKKVDIGMIASVLVGFLFMMLGNYMSKNRQNYTVGIRVPWTLNSEENWERTHRFASKLWVVSGVLLILNSFFKNGYIFGIVIILTAVVPVIYSFVLYKKMK